jgi:hypothetical protein
MRTRAKKYEDTCKKNTCPHTAIVHYTICSIAARRRYSMRTRAKKTHYTCLEDASAHFILVAVQRHMYGVVQRHMYMYGVVAAHAWKMLLHTSYSRNCPAIIDPAHTHRELNPAKKPE